MDAIAFELSWKTRRQRPLTPKAEQVLRRALNRVAKTHGWQVYFLLVAGAQVTLNVRADTHASAHRIQHLFKRASSPQLRKLREYRNATSLWTRKYTAKTVTMMLFPKDDETKMSGFFTGELHE